MAKQLKEFHKEVESLITKGVEKDEAIFQVLRKCITASKKILFEGNNYGDDWVKEAKKRGLPNVTTTPHALDAFVTKRSMHLFEEMGIYNEKEMDARHDISLDSYVKRVQIESRLMSEIVDSSIIPIAVKYQNQLIENIKGLKEVLNGTSAKFSKVQVGTLVEISERIGIIKENVNAMIEARKKANQIEKMRDRAIAYCEKVKPYFDVIRYNVDKLELIIDDNMWPLPKYREMLFTR